MTDGTIWLREYKTMAEVCDAWAKDRQRIEELETVRDDMRLLARDRGEKLAEHWKRIQELEAQVKVADGLKDEYSLLLVRNKVLKAEQERMRSEFIAYEICPDCGHRPTHGPSLKPQYCPECGWQESRNE